MAYSNTIAAGDGIFDAGSTFARGLVWTALAVVAFLIATAFDYKWLRTFAWPLYFVNLGLLVLTLAIGDGVSGAARWISIGPWFQFQFSELAKILMIVVLANYLASRQKSLDSIWTILGACLLVGAGLGARPAPARPRARRSSSPGSSPGCCSCRAPACAGWPSSRP